MKNLNKSLLSVFVVFCCFVNVAKAQFVHPGITHKKSDLDRIKHMVEAQVDPWFTSYQEMVSDSKSSYDYIVQGDPSFTELGRDNKVNYGAWNSDIRAAYYNAIRWYVEGDSRYAEKAIEIFNAWVNLEAVTSNGTMALSGGVGYIMIEAAEIIKHTYSGWTEADRKKFEDMLVFPGYSNTQVPAGISRTYGTFYWQSYQGDSGRHGNQGLSGWRTVMAIGIFLDNEIIYDRAYNYITGQTRRADDLPYPSGPPTRGSLVSSTNYADSYSTTAGTTIPDYRFNEQLTYYIWENGQCQESSRDQQHTAFGIGLLTSMAEMAWNQGDNLYSYANDRLLLGLEYNMKYNVSAIETYPDQTTPWEPTVASGEFVERDDRTKRWFSKAVSPDGRGEFPGIRPVYEMPIAHFLGRGLKQESEVLWTKRARDKAIEISGYESAGWTNDAIGWGGLTARRPAYCYGDPITGFDANNLPLYSMNLTETTIEAENFDVDPIFQGESRTYHDITSTNTGNEYRLLDAVDIETKSGGYAITSIEAEEWLSYTIAVPERALYSISIDYAAIQSGGTISVIIGGEEKTSEIEVPFGTPNSTGASDWKSVVVAQDILLEKGVQSLRIKFGGTSNAFKLDAFSVLKTGNAKNDQTIQFFTLPAYVLGAANFSPNAQASSVLPVTYTSSNESVAKIVNNEIEIVAAGTATITASQMGDASYFAAPNVTQELHVVSSIDGTTSLSAVADAYVHESNPSTNYGDAEVLVTKAEGRFAYLKFDLSSIPGSIISAKLRVYQRTGFRDLRVVYDVEDDTWTESGITWNNKPSFNNERSSITTNSTWNEWDIASYAAQEFYNDKIITLVIKDPVNSGVGIDLRSKEFDPNFAPELIVEYANESLGVQEFNSKIKLYPNPVSKTLTVALNGISINDASLYSIQGKKIKQAKFNNKELCFDVSVLNSGIYILIIESEFGTIQRKIVKI